MMSVRRVPIRRQQILLLLVDLAILFVSLPVAVTIRQAGGPEDLPPFRIVNTFSILVDTYRYWTGATLVSMTVFLVLFFVFDLYAPETKTRSVRDLFRIMIISGVAVPIITVFYFFVPNWKVATRSLLIFQAV